MDMPSEMPIYSYERQPSFRFIAIRQCEHRRTSTPAAISAATAFLSGSSWANCSILLMQLMMPEYVCRSTQDSSSYIVMAYIVMAYIAYGLYSLWPI